MNKIVFTAGTCLVLYGVYEGVVTAKFQRAAIEVAGRVTAVEQLPGPPKPRQRVPLHVLYTMPDGNEVRAVTHLPLLQEIHEGDTIRLLVDPTVPHDARLPLLSELWARPLTFVVGGMLMVIVARVLGSRRAR